MSDAPTDVDILKNALTQCGNDRRRLRDRWGEAVRERDKARVQRDALREVLAECRHAISFAPEDAFGYVPDEETGKPAWPVQHELMQRAADALAALDEGSDDGQ